MAAPGCRRVWRSKSTGRGGGHTTVSQQALVASHARGRGGGTRLGRGQHTADALDDDIGGEADAAGEHEGDGARQPACLCATSRHHRVVASLARTAPSSAARADATAMVCGRIPAGRAGGTGGVEVQRIRSGACRAGSPATFQAPGAGCSRGGWVGRPRVWWDYVGLRRETAALSASQGPRKAQAGQSDRAGWAGLGWAGRRLVQCRSLG